MRNCNVINKNLLFWICTNSETFWPYWRTSNFNSETWQGNIIQKVWVVSEPIMCHTYRLTVALYAQKIFRNILLPISCWLLVFCCCTVPLSQERQGASKRPTPFCRKTFNPNFLHAFDQFYNGPLYKNFLLRQFMGFDLIDRMLSTFFMFVQR